MCVEKEELKKMLNESEEKTGLIQLSGTTGSTLFSPLQAFTKTIFSLKSIAKQSRIDELNKILRENLNEFPRIFPGEILETVIKEKNLTNSEVIKQSGVSKDYFSKIINNKRRPSRNKAIQLCFGLKLTEDEACDFLKKMGHNELYLRDEMDFIIYAALHKKLTLNETEDLLDKLGYDTLQGE